jgi:hypothetical protein
MAFVAFAPAGLSCEELLDDGGASGIDRWGGGSIESSTSPPSDRCAEHSDVVTGGVCGSDEGSEAIMNLADGVDPWFSGVEIALSFCVSDDDRPLSTDDDDDDDDDDDGSSILLLLLALVIFVPSQSTLQSLASPSGINLLLTAENVPRQTLPPSSPTSTINSKSSSSSSSSCPTNRFAMRSGVAENASTDDINCISSDSCRCIIFLSVVGT